MSAGTLLRAAGALSQNGNMEPGLPQGRQHPAQYLALLPASTQVAGTKAETSADDALNGEKAANKLENFIAALVLQGLADFASVYIIQRDQYGIPGFGIAAIQGAGSEHFPAALPHWHRAQPTAPPIAHVSMDCSRSNTKTQATTRTGSLDSRRRPAFNMYNARSARLFRLDGSGWTVTDAKMQGKARLYTCRRPHHLTGVQPMEAPWLAAAGMRSMLSVPCIHDGRICGSVLLASRGMDWQEKVVLRAVRDIAPAVDAAGPRLAAGLPVHRFVPADEIACGVLHELVHLDKILMCRIMAPDMTPATQEADDVKQQTARQLLPQQLPNNCTNSSAHPGRLHAPPAATGTPDATVLSTIKAYYRQAPAKAPQLVTGAAANPTHATSAAAAHTAAHMLTADPTTCNTPHGSISLSGMPVVTVRSPAHEQDARTKAMAMVVSAGPALLQHSHDEALPASTPAGLAADVSANDQPLSGNHGLSSMLVEPSAAQQQSLANHAPSPELHTHTPYSVNAALRRAPDACSDACQDAMVTVAQPSHRASFEPFMTHPAASPSPGMPVQPVVDTRSWQVDELLDTAQQPRGSILHLSCSSQHQHDISREARIVDTAEVSSASRSMLSRLQGACNYMVVRASIGEADGEVHRAACSEDLLEASKRAAMAAAGAVADRCMPALSAKSQPMVHGSALDAPSNSSATASGAALWSSAHVSHSAAFDPYSTTKDLTYAVHSSSVGLNHQHHLSSTHINLLMLQPSPDNSLDLGTADSKQCSPAPAINTALEKCRSHGARSGRKPASSGACVGASTPLSPLSHGQQADRMQDVSTSQGLSTCNLAPTVVPVSAADAVPGVYMQGDTHHGFMMGELGPQEQESIQAMPSWASPRLDAAAMEYMSSSLQYTMESLGPHLAPRAFAQAKMNLATDHECVQLASTSLLFSPTSRPAAAAGSSSTGSKAC